MLSHNTETLAAMKNILITLLILPLIITGCNQTQNRDNQTFQTPTNNTERINNDNSVNIADSITSSEKDPDNTKLVQDKDIISRTPLDLDAKFRILPLGQFHYDEIPSNTKKLKWVALYHNGSESYLKEIKPELTKIFDAVYDGVGQQSAWKISVENSSQCVLLINAKGLEEGTIPSFKVKAKPRPGDTLSFIHETYLHKLYITGLPSSMAYSIDNYKMMIEIFQKDQVITQNIINYSSTTTHEEDLPSIIWTGDLDSDGKLDFIIEKPSYNTSRVELILSTLYHNNEPLKPAAVFQSHGC